MAEARTIGSSPVANVQELAEACNSGVDGRQVPERYLVGKDPISAEEVVAVGDDDSACAIPVIDLRRLLDARSEEEECARLASACHDWGFFQLINHGVPDEVIRNLMRDVAGFFEQPLEAKKEWSQRADSLEGYGQAFVVSDDQRLDWADMLYLQVQPTESRDMRFWPTRPESFRHSVDAYASEARQLAHRLLEFMARGVGADPAPLQGVFEGQAQGMRVNYYPPCRRAADRVLGLSPHTDPNGLTLLLQKNHDVQGLQVKKDGRWFAVRALDGAIVVNVGDALEIVSNGLFRSVEHRAVIHPTKERISVALFHYPYQDRMLGPLPELVKKGGGRARYGPTSYRDFLTQYFTAELDGRKHLERLKLDC